ncbi:hypothetical protein FA15DRAFT_662576 [Coprinopsis marcescibilis]|uniref:DNA-binding protein RAP1 n=1 Tax=Coprinopsis marcescibilis TaxID=230819 RepID=A0A5C3LD57_COPMA|nr:hypothetical protein FA15DRAFT_662576 [Coprinopsis marcescibilis]
MIFQDSNNLPTKFFIAKDIPQDVQTDLRETIAALGGRVEAKVPRQGYVLVQPGSQEEYRLRTCWTTKTRPERYFVPYTYVEACKISGELPKQIFLEDGEPITMHIHESIENPNVRNALSMRIMHSGGDTNVPIQDAKVILADPNTEVFQHLVKTYEGDSNKYIESYLWVKKCIDQGTVTYTPVIYKNPGGRRPGEERTQFSEDDEVRLCRWIAEKIPFKETGGRTGNRLYQQLVEQAHNPEYTWVSRHTWQSWRERYKKHSRRLDRTISAIVEQKQPLLGEKGQYGYVRQPEEKAKRTRKKRKLEQMGEASFTNPGDGSIALPNMTMGGEHPVDPLRLPVPPGFPNIPPHPGMVYPPLLPVASTSAVLQRPDHSKSPEEVEENEDAEWAIRVGNAPPPAWAHAPSEPGAQEHPTKRRRTSETEEEAGDTPDTISEATTNALVALASMHVIDHSLRGIAAEFRFTVEEVKEYYDKCGEMTETRNRFQQMRQVLTERFSA